MSQQIIYTLSNCGGDVLLCKFNLHTGDVLIIFFCLSPVFDKTNEFSFDSTFQFWSELDY